MAHAALARRWSRLTRPHRRRRSPLRASTSTSPTARAKLGRLLAKVDKSKGGRPPKNLSRRETGLRVYLPSGLDKTRASEAERIGAMPDQDRNKEFEQARKANVLNTVRGMASPGRPPSSPGPVNP